jgi:S1-C subfamily serine protease
MRIPALALLLIMGQSALAQKPPPLPPGVDATPRTGKTPYAGPESTGKPPPMDAPAPGGGPFVGRPRPTAPDGPDRRDPGGDDRRPVPSERASSSGTGFVVAPGRLMTNNHVVAECGRMVARNAQNRRVPARVLATDRRRDLALLEVPSDFGPPLAFRETPAVRRGETVVTYGFPLSGLLSSGPTLTTGDISALAGLRDNPVNFQISAPVQPGNSGGPLLDSHANVIGVIVSKLNAARIAEMTGGDIPQNVNFAVKGSEALAFLRANSVEPQVAPSTGPDKRNFEVGEIANPSTAYLQCYR